VPTTRHSLALTSSGCPASRPACGLTSSASAASTEHLPPCPEKGVLEIRCEQLTSLDSPGQDAQTSRTKSIYQPSPPPSTLACSATTETRSLTSGPGNSIRQSPAQTYLLLADPRRRSISTRYVCTGGGAVSRGCQWCSTLCPVRSSTSHLFTTTNIREVHSRLFHPSKMCHLFLS
jgi:hypothetical protein